MATDRDPNNDGPLQEWAERGLTKLRLVSRATAPTRPRDGDMAYADGTNWNPSGTGAGIYWYGLGSWYRLATGAGIPLVDGDKGDVVVSATGLTWTIDSNAVTTGKIDTNAVTFAKMQQIATARLLGRTTAGTGDVEALTYDQVRDVVYDDDWTDLVIPAVAINPAGAAAPPTLNNATGCLEFSPTIDNTVIFTFQMPHGWSGQFDNTKAVVVPHLHVRHLTSTSAPNNVSRWVCEYDVADANGNFTNAYGTYTAMATVSSTNPADTTKCGIVDLGDLDLSGYGASTILHIKVSRLASSDAADTDTSVIALYSADLHYQVRRSGTDTEIPT